MFDIFGICQSRSETEDFSASAENLNCCSRSPGKTYEDRVCTPRKDYQQFPTPWIREGYGFSVRENSAASAVDTIAPEFMTDIVLLRAELVEVENAIVEGERRIVLLATTKKDGSPTAQRFTKILNNLRIKSSMLSTKLKELEEIAV